MPRLKTCEESSLSKETLAALDPVRRGGRLSEVYLQFANSEPAIQAYLGMESALSAGSLGERDVESIKLLVSELTQCEYCLAIHSMKARAAGIDVDTQLAIRRGEALPDKRLNAILALVRALYTRPGLLDAELLAAARQAGISDTELVDITMAMSTIFFTNITNHINDTTISLAPAPKINA